MSRITGLTVVTGSQLCTSSIALIVGLSPSPSSNAVSTGTPNNTVQISQWKLRALGSPRASRSPASKMSPQPTHTGKIGPRRPSSRKVI